MFNLDDITIKNDDCAYKTLVIGPSGSGKTNYLLNKIQTDTNIIDKIFMKRLRRTQMSTFNKKREQAGVKQLNDPTAFIEYSNSMDDLYENIEVYNKKRKRKVLIVFDDMISKVMSNKKEQKVLKELFIRCRKINVSLCFLTQSYFSVSIDVRLNCIHYVAFKINKKKELQNIAINHSSDIDYKGFVKIYRNCTKEPYSFYTINTKVPVDKRFKKNFSGVPYKNDY